MKFPLVALLVAVALPAWAKHASDEVMVRFRPGTPAAAAEAAVRGIGAETRADIPQLGVRLVRLPPGLAVERAIERLRRNPNVDVAEPNRRLYPAALPNDPLLGSQWGLERIRARQAWAEGIAGAQGSPGVIIAVVDSGVMSSHPDLAPKIVGGFNAYDDSTLTEPGSFPGANHGTAVASVAAAATDNGKGMAGVGWLARVMPIKIDDPATGEMTEFHAFKGVAWAVEHGARVINMSLGSCETDPGTGLVDCGDPSAIGADTMRYAYERGAVLVASAGNESTSRYSYPAAYPHVLGVSATTRDDRIAGYSNWGAYVDVAAPGGVSALSCSAGQDILAATTASACGAYGAAPDDYFTASGTSSAAPHVAGLAAVLFGQNPARTNGEVMSLIQSTARLPPGGPAPSPDWHVTYDSPGANEDGAYGVAIDASGNVIVIGREKRLDLVETNNWRIFKYDPAGAVVWTRTHNGGPNMDDGAAAVAVDASGNVVVAGYETTSLLEMKKWLVRKYDGAGTLLWGRNYDSPGVVGDDRAEGVAVDAAGNVIAAGYEQRGAPGGRNLLVRKYTNGGALVWSRSYVSPGADDGANAVAADSDGNVIVAGYEDRSDLGQGFNWFVRKYDGAGAAVWTERYNGPANGSDGAAGVAVDALGDVVVAGYEDRSDLGQGYDWLVRKYSAAGVLLWVRSYDSPVHGNDAANAVAADASGNFVVAGSADMSNQGEGMNIMVRKYDGDGNLLWSMDQNSSATSWDQALGVAVRGEATVVAGVENATGAQKDSDWSVFSYAGGAAAWTEWNNYYGHGLIDMYAALTGTVPVTAAVLRAALKVLPSPLGAGGIAQAVLTVVNSGSGDATEVAVSLGVPAGGGLVSLAGAPPAVVLDRLAKGGSAAFTWSYVGVAAGRVTFAGAATGVDEDTGGILSASASEDLEVLAAPESPTEFMVYPNPVSGDVLKIAIPLRAAAEELTVRVYNAASLKLAARGVWRNVAAGEGGVIMDRVREWAPGMYLVRVRARLAGGETQEFPTVKLMVQR